MSTIHIVVVQESPVAMERVVEAAAIVAMAPYTVETAASPIAMLSQSAVNTQKLQVKNVH